MNFTQIFSAILAGGLAGQLVTLYWGNKSKSNQDLRNWLRQERYKAFTELLSLVSATAPRSDYDTWPTDIRIASQKIHLLSQGGVAPDNVADSMERIYQLARKKKKDLVTDHDMWTNDFRDEVRKLRVALSEILNDSN